jgi:hypothetical protein
MVFQTFLINQPSGLQTQEKDAGCGTRQSEMESETKEYQTMLNIPHRALLRL